MMKNLDDHTQRLLDALWCSLEEIDNSIVFIKLEATKQHISPYQMRLMDGSWPLTNMLAAKAQVLHSLALLKET